MNHQLLGRRRILKYAAIASTACVLPSCASVNTETKELKNKSPFSYCLNTSTIMGQELGLEREIEIAAETGYDGIEIWIPTLNTYLENGGNLTELHKKLADLNIRVDNAIGFAHWIVDNNVIRRKALEQVKIEMNQLAQLGCKRIAAPPAGATDAKSLNLDQVADRYYELIQIGKEAGVMPQLEVWGFSKHLNKLSQVLYVAAECGSRDARILPDVYHLYKGGSDFNGLKLLRPDSIDIFHMNDYPSNPDRKMISDKDRVYPGQGVAPFKQILSDLSSCKKNIILSIELFNREYWKQDPVIVAKRALEAMKSSVALI